MVIYCKSLSPLWTRSVQSYSWWTTELIFFIFFYSWTDQAFYESVNCSKILIFFHLRKKELLQRLFYDSPATSSLRIWWLFSGIWFVCLLKSSVSTPWLDNLVFKWENYQKDLTHNDLQYYFSTWIIIHWLFVKYLGFINIFRAKKHLSCRYAYAVVNNKPQIKLKELTVLMTKLFTIFCGIQPSLPRLYK